MLAQEVLLKMLPCIIYLAQWVANLSWFLAIVRATGIFLQLKALQDVPDVEISSCS